MNTATLQYSTGIQALPSPVNSTIIKRNIHLNKSLSKVLRIQIHENKKKLPDRLADSCKRKSDGCRFEAAQGFFLLSSTFQTHFVQLTKPSQVFVRVRPTGIHHQLIPP